MPLAANLPDYKAEFMFNRQNFFDQQRFSCVRELHCWQMAKAFPVPCRQLTYFDNGPAFDFTSQYLVDGLGDL